MFNSTVIISKKDHLFGIKNAEIIIYSMIYLSQNRKKKNSKMYTIYKMKQVMVSLRNSQLLKKKNIYLFAYENWTFHSFS